MTAAGRSGGLEDSGAVERIETPPPPATGLGSCVPRARAVVQQRRGFFRHRCCLVGALVASICLLRPAARACAKHTKPHMPRALSGRRSRMPLLCPSMPAAGTCQSLYCPQDRGCGHVPNALRANRAYATRLGQGSVTSRHVHRPRRGLSLCGRCRRRLAVFWMRTADGLPSISHLTQSRHASSSWASLMCSRSRRWTCQREVPPRWTPWSPAPWHRRP